MPLTSLWQFLIPDSLLLEIFTYLDIRNLGHVAQVCRLWRRVSHDELLWQKVARRRWNLKGPICRGKRSWRSEVKRLVHHVPCVQSEIFTDAHVDEVLDVCISHGGDMFCTTSKDSSVILWKLDYPSTEINRVNTHDLFSWSLTQYSKFNNDDSLLLVCGVTLPTGTHHFWPDSSLGRGAVFTVPELIPLQMVNLDPPTLFGAWLTSDIFIGGNLQGLHGAIKIVAHKVPDTIPIDIDWKTSNYAQPEQLFYFRGNKHHQMSILVADVACSDEAEDAYSESNATESSCMGTGTSGMSEEQPGNIYQLLSGDYDNVKHRQNVSRGGGDSDLEPDFIKHKRMRLKSTDCDSFTKVVPKDKVVNPNILDLENNASFWDRDPSADSSDHQHLWQSDSVTDVYYLRSGYSSDSRPETFCCSECCCYRSAMTDQDSDVSDSLTDISSDASCCTLCRKAKSNNSQLASTLKRDTGSSESHVMTCDKPRSSRSDMTVSSSSEFLTDSGSVSITGLSLCSDFSESDTNTIQNEDSYCQFSSGSSKTEASKVDSNQDTSKDDVGVLDLSCDRYFNTGSSTDRNPSSSQNTARNSEFSGDKLYYNTDIHTNISSSTLVGEETPRNESNDSGIKYFSNPSRSCSNRQGNYRKYVCFVSGAHDAVVVQEVTVDKLDCLEEQLDRNDEESPVIEREAGVFDDKDYYFFIKDCYITGMCLSRDHRYLYFNYREWAKQEDEESEDDVEPDDPHRDVSERNFHENIKVGVIDLVNMCWVEELTYEGHIGYSSYPAWYICLGASEDYLGSGSENARAYLWDRHYRVKVAELPHKLLVVNGIAFSPIDQEVCVSVCDDKSIIVWRSRNRMAELADSNQT